MRSSGSKSIRLSLSALLARQLAARGNEVCLIEEGETISWRAFATRVDALADALTGQGVVAGDRVAIWLPNRSAWLATFFACCRIGAIAVSINTRFRSGEVADLLYRSGAKLLFYWPGFKDIDFSGILARCEPESLVHLQAVVLYAEDDRPLPQTVVGKPVVDARALLAARQPHRATGTAESPCVIFTTSGTTRAPKLVVHKQANVVLHAENVARQYGYRKGHCFLLIPPFCGVFGFCNAMAAMAAGIPLILDTTWNPPLYANLIDRYRVTHLAGSNEAVAQLLAERTGAPPFPSIEYMVSANINPAHADIPLRGAARGVLVYGLYGSSELQAAMSRCEHEADVERTGRAGGTPASSLCKVRARDPESGAVLPHGEAGELEILAPESRFVEYLNDAEATAKAFTADGYFRTGDLGFSEADGSFTYLGRMGDTLRLGGFLVSPAEIEGVIQDHPAVEACQLVGAMTREALMPVAFIRVRTGRSVSEAEIIAFTNERLAKFKVPVKVVTLDEFPTTPSANGFKVQKNKLREMAEALLNG